MNYPDTQFLRAFAIILITNSHLDSYYPIPYIGTGGAIGNSIFFCLSAFGIYLSQQKKHQPFSEWLSGRISRIYPSMWIVLLFLTIPIMFALGQVNDESIMLFIGKFFNPPYWFIRALLVYYILSFFLLGDEQKTKLFSIFGLLGVLYFVIYLICVDLSKWTVEDSSIKLIHYFMIFLFGIYLATKNRAIVYSGIHNYFVLLFLVAVVYGHKFLMTKGLYTEFQFIQQAAMYPIVFYLLKISRSSLVLSMVNKSNFISTTIQFLSNHTLELYIIQTTIIWVILNLKFPFPLNMIVFLFLTCIFSALVNKLASTIRTRLN